MSLHTHKQDTNRGSMNHLEVTEIGRGFMGNLKKVIFCCL